MQVYEWIGLIGLALALFGGMAAWVFSIQEKAKEAMAETQKNAIRIEDVKNSLGRGERHFSEIRSDISYLKDGMARVEEQMKNVAQNLVRLDRSEKG